MVALCKPSVSDKVAEGVQLGDSCKRVSIANLRTVVVTCPLLEGHSLEGSDPCLTAIIHRRFCRMDAVQ